MYTSAHFTSRSNTARPAGVVDVERDPALVPVRELEEVVGPVGVGRQAVADDRAHGIAVEALDLHDVGAPVGERGGADGTKPCSEKSTILIPASGSVMNNPWMLVVPRGRREKSDLRQADHRSADGLALLHRVERGRKLERTARVGRRSRGACPRRTSANSSACSCSPSWCAGKLNPLRRLNTTGSSTYAWHTPTSEKFPNSTGRGTSPSSSCSMPDAKPARM